MPEQAARREDTGGGGPETPGVVLTRSDGDEHREAPDRLAPPETGPEGRHPADTAPGAAARRQSRVWRRTGITTAAASC